MTQLDAAAYIRQGQIPFFRLPLADLRGPRPYEGAGAVLLGVPWDGGVTHAPGARFAPWEVRRASATVQSFHCLHEIDVFSRLAVLDGGNVMVPPFSATAARELIQVEIGSVLEAGAKPFVVGGDHSIALPILRAVAKRHGPVFVVHIDAHLDTSSGDLWGDDFHHGTPFRHALEERLIRRGGLAQIGIRGSTSGPEEVAFGEAHGAVVYSIDHVEDRGVVAIAKEIKTAAGDAPVYISFDIDGVDPAFAPGTGTPVPGGLSAREAIRLLRNLAGVRLVGMDLVEVCPALDHADLTVQLAAELLYEGLALAALCR